MTIQSEETPRSSNPFVIQLIPNIVVHMALRLRWWKHFGLFVIFRRNGKYSKVYSEPSPTILPPFPETTPNTINSPETIFNTALQIFLVAWTELEVTHCPGLKGAITLTINRPSTAEVLQSGTQNGHVILQPFELRFTSLCIRLGWPVRVTQNAARAEIAPEMT